MTRSERIYRALLHAYSPGTRAAFADDMAQLFIDQLRDAPDRPSAAAVWVLSILDIAIDAPRERLSRGRVAKVVHGPALTGRRSLAADMFAATTPLLFLGLFALVAPRSLDILFDERLSIVGTSVGVLTAGFAILTGLAVLATRRGLRERSTRVLALAALAAPLPALLYMFGIETAIGYSIAAGLLLAILSVRWLSVAIIVPFVLWVILGPAIVLIVINLNPPGA
jgi:hypothetical protein